MAPPEATTIDPTVDGGRPVPEHVEIPPPPKPAEYEGVERSSGTVLILVGGALAVLGLVLLANPFAAIWILGVLIGLSLIAGGLAEIVSNRGSSGSRVPGFVVGGLIIVAGIVAAAWPDATVWALAVVAGVGLVISGGIGIVGSLGGDGTKDRSLVLGLSVASLVIGIVVLAWPDATLTVLAVLLGFRTLLNGLVSIGIGINIRRFA
jgi:uncharacterized membrane protein HdeD (DUF308 family)